MKYLSLILVISILLLTGCNDEYSVLSKEYYSLYQEIAREVESLDVEVTIDKLQEEEVVTKIEKLEEILKQMELVVPEKKVNQYEKYLEWYQGLMLLKNSTDWENLSFQEREAAFVEYLVMGVRLN